MFFIPFVLFKESDRLVQDFLFLDVSCSTLGDSSVLLEILEIVLGREEKGLSMVV